MRIEQINVDAIGIGRRHREVDDAAVKTLMESMQTIGLQTPISVTVEADPDTKSCDCQVKLVAGRHRLEAARRLGWAEIDIIEVDLDDIDAELWEIDENLARKELTIDERRQHLRRRKELWEQRQSEVVAHDAPKPKSGPQGGRPKGFAAETAAATGLSKSQINRLLAEPKSRPTTVKPVPPPEPAPELVADIVNRGDPDEALSLLRDALGMLILINPDAMRGHGEPVLIDFIGMAGTNLSAIREALEGRADG